MGGLLLTGAFFVCWGWLPSSGSVTHYLTYINGAPHSATPDVGACACVEYGDHLEVYAVDGYTVSVPSERHIGTPDFNSHRTRMAQNPDVERYCD